MKPPITTYIVEVLQSSRWHTVLTTKDKKKALDALKPLGKNGRITELTPKRK